MRIMQNKIEYIYLSTTYATPLVSVTVRDTMPTSFSRLGDA